MDFRSYHILCIRLVLTLFLLGSIISCVNEPNREDSLPGIPVKVELSFRVPKFNAPQPSSRTLTSEDSFSVNLLSAEESGEAEVTRASSEPLYNLWVLQFAADGSKRKVVRASTSTEPVYENQTIEVELLTGTNQTIYLLSLGKQYEDIDLSNINSLKELEETKFSFVRYINGMPEAIIKDAADVPYRGFSSKLSIIQLASDGSGYVDYRNSPGFTGAISMKALVALVSMEYSYQVDNMTPFSIGLNNVPTTFVVNDDNYKPSQFVDLSPIMLNPADFAGGKRSIINWYMAPNKQGQKPSITEERNRYFYYPANSTVPVGTAPSDGTYVHFWASKDGVDNNYALYYIFLGSNNTTDFNVYSHSHYRYRTDINTADDINDKRIVFKTLKQTIDFAATNFQNTAGNPIGLLKEMRSGTIYDLDTHPEMRPMEITALRGSFSVEVTSSPGSTQTLPTEQSWIKLSSYSNYTAALNGKLAGDANALTTKIEHNVKIPGLFRLYVYSDEYEKYVVDNPNNHKRTIYLRFTFKTSTNQSEVYIAKMDQLPGFYLGEFGGEFKKGADGVFRYQQGLVLEARRESATANQFLSYYPAGGRSVYPAYYGINMTYAEVKEHDAFDMYNGRSATIKMSENRYKMPDIAPNDNYYGKIETPIYSGGHVDLYQYKHYNGDVFAQRVCYDKNRDKNGDGVLKEEDGEIMWYAPAMYQAMSMGLNYYNTTTDYFRNTSEVSGIGISSIHVVNAQNGVAPVSFSLLSFTNSIPGSTNTVNYRCVRDVPAESSLAGGVKYYEEDGYAVIDASELMSGIAEDRVNNPNVMISPSDHPNGNQSHVGRVKRHFLLTGATMNDIDRKISRRFRVAPRDIDAAGNLVSKQTHITWATAMGYDQAANTLPLDGGFTEVAESGCPAFKGNSGVEDTSLGKWRIPTIREAMLICMMDKVMGEDSSVTKYVPLYLSDNNFFYYYWIASEPDYVTGGANALFSSLKSASKGYTENPYLRRVTYSSKAGTINVSARCIQDLH